MTRARSLEAATTQPIAGQEVDKKRDEVIEAISKKLREAIEFAFGTTDKPRAIGKESPDTDQSGTLMDAFLKKGTTYIARSAVGSETCNEQGFTLANTRIAQISQQQTVVDDVTDGNGKDADQESPLDMYTKGIRVILEKLLAVIKKPTDFKKFDIKVAATDKPLEADDVKSNTVNFCDNLSNFTPPAVSSKGTK